MFDFARILERLHANWSWSDVQFDTVLQISPMGNVIVADRTGVIWRVSPEDCELRRIAENRSELDRVMASNEFQSDWLFEDVVWLAERKLGPLSDEEVYTYIPPPALTGEYNTASLAKMYLHLLLIPSGAIARHRAGKPDQSISEVRVLDE